MKHFISANEWTAEEIFSVLAMAEECRQNKFRVNQQVFAANLFFEPSTRTKMSFIVAQKKLGLEPLEFHAEASSMKKGESLYDTAKTFEALGANLLIIRHEDDTWPNELRSTISIPIINAGAGKLEHPTQCLLDLDTIYQEFASFKDLNIVIVGDIKHSRVAHSNITMLSKLGANIYLSAAPGFEDDTLNFPYISLDEAVEIADVMMLLRIQHERHHGNLDMLNYHKKYGLTKERERKMRQNAIILHPAPVNRGIEIDSELVECRRSRIFKQMENGVYVRMAIMTRVLLEWGIINEYDIEKRETITTNKRIRIL